MSTLLGVAFVQGLVGRHLDVIQQILPNYDSDMDMMFVTRPIRDVLFGYLDPVLLTLSESALIGKGLNPYYRGTPCDLPMLQDSPAPHG